MTAELQNTEFVGNKNQKFLNWLERQPLSREGKSRVASAIKRFGAELLNYDEALRYVESELKKDDFKNLYDELENLVAENRRAGKITLKLIEL